MAAAIRAGGNVAAVAEGSIKLGVNSSAEDAAAWIAADDHAGRRTALCHDGAYLLGCRPLGADEVGFVIGRVFYTWHCNVAAEMDWLIMGGHHASLHKK